MSKHIPDKCGKLECGQVGRDNTLHLDGGLWVCPICGGSYGAGKKETLQDRLAEELDGSDWCRGELEGLSETVDRLRTFCASLGAALVDKGLFTEDEVLDMVHGG